MCKNEIFLSYQFFSNNNENIILRKIKGVYFPSDARAAEPLFYEYLTWHAWILSGFCTVVLVTPSLELNLYLRNFVYRTLFRILFAWIIEHSSFSFIFNILHGTSTSFLPFISFKMCVLRDTVFYISYVLLLCSAEVARY